MKRRTIQILGAEIDALTWSETIGCITNWGSMNKSAYICICNAHSVVTASQDPEHLAVLNEADLNTPDGAPIAWAMRRLGQDNQKRINGPDLMWYYCAEAEKLGQKVFFYGSTDEVLHLLDKRLKEAFPNLIANYYSPPFRNLTEEEDQAIIDRINNAGTSVLFVGLGCPKQEKWMADHKGKISSVMIGVGAAFGYHAGTLKRAPLWMQHIGLEWLHRLCSEPKRLAKRYLVTNTLFVYGIIRQLLSRHL